MSGFRLKAFLERVLALFSDSGREYIMKDIVRHGIRFDEKSRYTLVQVKEVPSVLGEDDAALVISRMRRERGRAPRA